MPDSNRSQLRIYKNQTKNPQSHLKILMIKTNKMILQAQIDFGFKKSINARHLPQTFQTYHLALSDLPGISDNKYPIIFSF